MNRAPAILALAIFLLPHLSPGSVPPEEPDTFSFEPNTGVLFLRLAPTDQDRYFAWCARVNFADGTSLATSFGCFPIVCTAGFSPIGSTVLAREYRDREIVSVDMFWSKNDSIQGDVGMKFDENPDNRFENLQKRGATLLRLVPEKHYD